MTEEIQNELIHVLRQKKASFHEAWMILGYLDNYWEKKKTMPISKIKEMQLDDLIKLSAEMDYKSLKGE